MLLLHSCAANPNNQSGDFYKAVQALLGKDPKYHNNASCMTKHLEENRIYDRLYQQGIENNATALRLELEPFLADSFKSCQIDPPTKEPPHDGTRDSEKESGQETNIPQDQGISVWIWIAVVAGLALILILGIILFKKFCSSDSHQMKPHEMQSLNWNFDCKINYHLGLRKPQER